MHPHTKFGFPNSKKIRDMLGTQLFSKLGQRSRSPWPKNGMWHPVIPRYIYTPNLEFLLKEYILRDFKNAPFYILCLFHMINLRMYSLSFFILLQNGPWFAMILICSCCLFRRNIDVSVFQQLSSDKCEFDSIWKQTLLCGSQMSYQIEKQRSFQK